MFFYDVLNLNYFKGKFFSLEFIFELLFLFYRRMLKRDFLLGYIDVGKIVCNKIKFYFYD